MSTHELGERLQSSLRIRWEISRVSNAAKHREVPRVRMRSGRPVYRLSLKDLPPTPHLPTVDQRLVEQREVGGGYQPARAWHAERTHSRRAQLSHRFLGWVVAVSH
jgi:hypothetical protein